MVSECSPCLLGQYNSCSAAQQPVELSEIILQNLSEQVAAPPGTGIGKRGGQSGRGQPFVDIEIRVAL